MKEAKRRTPCSAVRRSPGRWMLPNWQHRLFLHLCRGDPHSRSIRHLPRLSNVCRGIGSFFCQLAIDGAANDITYSAIRTGAGPTPASIQALLGGRLRKKARPTDEKGIDHILRNSLGTILADRSTQRGQVMKMDPQGQPPEPNLSDKALDEQQDWLRVTLSSIGDAVITTDASGNVTFLNPVAESLIGWSLNEASGVPLDVVFKIVNEETRRTVENPATRALREGLVVGLANHTLLIAKDGTERPIDDSAAPIRNHQGEIARCRPGLPRHQRTPEGRASRARCASPTPRTSLRPCATRS